MLKNYGGDELEEDWNPMEEAYFNERFNKYDSGPGADLERSLQPCFRKRNEIQRPLCKLFVHQIPRNLTEEGLRNLFLKFGIPRSVYLCKKPCPNNYSWALVEFSTVSEGQEAINSLNGRPPLNLNVQFARSDEEKERIRRECEQEYFFRKMSHSHDSSSDNSVIESVYPRSIGRGRGVPMFVSSPSSDPYHSNKPYWLYDDELMFKKPIPKGVFTPYRGSVWDPSNTHLMNEVSLTVNSSEDGRKISMGRAVPCVETRRRRIYNHTFPLRPSNVDHNGLRIGLCVSCSGPSIYSCERCGAWYCSDECQLEDWQMHKEICISFHSENMGRIRSEGGYPLNTEFDLKSIKKSEKWKGGLEREKGQNKGRDFSEKLKKTVRLMEERKCLAEETREDVKYCEKREGREEGRNHERKEDEYFSERIVVNKGDDTIRPSTLKDDNWGKDEVKENVIIEAEKKKIMNSEDPSRISETTELDSEKFTMVNVASVLSPGHYWVQSKDTEIDLISVMKIMKEIGKPTKEPMNVNVGDFCSAMFEGFPYRARVLSIKNDKIEVFFIDFGNVDICNLSDVGKLPADAWSYRSQAIEITMAEHTPQEFLNLTENSVVSVKAISKRNNLKIVQVEGVNYEESSPALNNIIMKNLDSSFCVNARKEWPKSVLNLLKEGMTAVCDVFDVMKGDDCMAILGMAFDDVAEDLFTVFSDFSDKCSNMAFDEAFKPQIGDLIAGSVDDEKWFRGVVLSKECNGWMVAFCDTGSVEVVRYLKKIPDDVKYREAPAFAIQCKILKSFIPRKELYSENRIKLSSSLNLNIVRCCREEVEANMMTKEGELFCRVKLEQWRPEVSNLICHILKNDDKVHIVSYFNTAAIFVQAADKISQKNIQSLLQEVAGSCIDDEGRMNEAPAKGTLVACKYSGDGNFYRALVVDVKEDNKIFVSYIDFGNQEWVPLEKVHQLPNALKKIPCHAVKIGLKLPEICQLTAETVQLFNTLILNSEELRIVFPDGDLRNCELFTTTGDCLNDKILRIENHSNPVSSINLVNGRIKWTSDMVGKLEIPKNGSLSLKFLILHCPGKCTVVGCPADDPRIPHVYKTFPVELSEYCENCLQAPYVPVLYELCVAKFTDGLWYRGFAADAKGDESQIFFVDFGNWMKVKHKDIRKMIPEFMKVPFIAVLCTYKGFEEETISKEQENVLKKYFKPNSLYLASISQGQTPYEYVLDIPVVTQELKSRNIIPSL